MITSTSIHYPDGRTGVLAIAHEYTEAGIVTTYSVIVGQGVKSIVTFTPWAEQVV
jgi:hypothetical protein